MAEHAQGEPWATPSSTGTPRAPGPAPGSSRIPVEQAHLFQGIPDLLIGETLAQGPHRG